MAKYSYCIFFFALLLSCGTADEAAPVEETISTDKKDAPAAAEKQLNINILWDISDRIDNQKNPSTPEQYVKDVEMIKTLAEIFKKDMQRKGAYKAKSKIRVLFSPTPANNEINAVAKGLSCDLSSLNGEEATKIRKVAYDSISNRFERNAKTIYQLAVNSNQSGDWPGSDIWRFFKNDVKDYCVEKNKGYRNILVIITDGYIYHKDSKDRSGNRTAFVTAEMLKPFRTKGDWKQTFEKGDYGLISTRSDLQDLEVLVVEITPSKEHRNDEDILKAYLTKWFKDMGVAENNIACYNSDLPEYTRNKIVDFVNR